MTGWTNTAEDPFSVPAGRLPTDPGIVRGTALPAPLDTYQWGPALQNPKNRYAAADIYYTGRGADTYDYLAVAVTPLGTVIHFGHVEAGAVVEYEPGVPAALELSYGFGATGRQYDFRGNQFHAQALDSILLGTPWLRLQADLIDCQGNLHLAGDQDVTGTLVVNGSAMTPQNIEDPTNLTGFTNVTPAPGTPVVAGTFVAPPSGRVHVSITGFIYSSQVGFYTALGWELRTGGIIGAGSIVSGYGTSADRAVCSSENVATGAPATTNATVRTLVTGLTPGNTYNVRSMHWVNATGGNGTVEHRRLEIEPSIT